MRIERIGGAVLYNGDCLAVLKTLADASVDSVVTDPPYHLTSIVKRFGGKNAAPAKTKQTGAFARSSKGFMGKTWDGGDIAFQVELWVEVLRVLKPGGHLVAFSGTRTYHRMAVAIEDAGFEIRDQLAWTYGSGFPKGGLDDQGRGKALKPAWEPIALARKPFKGTAAANIKEHGTGALNIDGCRVGESGARNNGRKVDSDIYGKFGPTERVDYQKGRFPANLVHDGSPEVLAAFPEAGGGAAGGQSGKSSIGGQNVYGGGWNDGAGRAARATTDKGGSAARFFYCAKASKADRGEGNNHPTVKPTELMRWLCRLITPPGGLVLDPFTGSGSTGRGAVLEGFRFVGAELSEEYAAIALKRIAAVVGENDNAPSAPAQAGADLFSQATA